MKNKKKFTHCEESEAKGCNKNTQAFTNKWSKNMSICSKQVNNKQGNEKQGKSNKEV